MTADTATAKLIDTYVTEDEQHEIAQCFKGTVEWEAQACEVNAMVDDIQVRNFVKGQMKEEGYYSVPHWARATTEVIVQLEGVDEPMVALVDHGSEINIMKRSVFEKGHWPIKKDHGWFLRAANNTKNYLYGACPNVRVQIGNVADAHNFFVQEDCSYAVLLGQPFIVQTRMGTQVVDDGTSWAKIRSLDGTKEVQFMTVIKNHPRNRRILKESYSPSGDYETDF